jgi:hypothetical protein
MYSADDLCNAKKAVQDGLPVQTAAKLWNIPLTTLYDHVMERHSQSVGHPTFLKKEQEAYIVKALQFSAANGWPCDRKDLSNMIAAFCDMEKCPVPWKDCPGQKFMQNFEKRWSHELSKRKLEILTIARVRCLTLEVLDEFFAMVSSIYEKYDLHNHPEKVWNVDETGMSTNQDAKSCFFKKGTKEAYILCSTAGKTMYTVAKCSSASGEVLPPLVIYKAKHLYDTWCRGGPNGSLFMVSKSGWIERTIFESWFEDVSDLQYFWLTFSLGLL